MRPRVLFLFGVITGMAATLFFSYMYMTVARTPVFFVSFRSTNLRGINAEYAHMHKSLLDERDLSGVKLQSATLEGASLKGARLRGAILSGVHFDWANLEGVDLRGADLRNASLRRCTLRAADLRGTDLAGANLNGAKLWGADLRGSALDGATFTQACYDRHTRWPDGFDPSEHDMVYEVHPFTGEPLYPPDIID